MTTYGVTPAGWFGKRLEDIISEMEADLRAIYGNGLNLSPDSRIKKLIATLAKQHADAWEEMEAVYNSEYPDTAEDVSLDNVVARVGLERLPATRSRANVVARGVNGTALAVGFGVRVAGTLRLFSSEVAATINAALQQRTVDFVEVVNAATYTATVNGTPHAYVAGPTDTPSTVADQVAALINAGAQQPNVIAQQIAGKLVVTASAPGGVFTFSAVATIVLAITAADAALDTLRVNGDYVSLFDAGNAFTVSGSTGNDGAYTVQTSSPLGGNTVVKTNEDLPSSVADGSITIAPQVTTTNTDTFGAVVELLSEETGQVTATRLTLTEIATPVVGLDAVANPADAELGSEEETDKELRIRRARSLYFAGAGTLDAIRARVLNIVGVTDAIAYENTDLVTDANGLPGKSFEVIVEGGDDQDIADAIWSVKPAGIQSYGNAGPFTVLDSQGNAHDIYFSRPVDLLIYVEARVDQDVEQGAYPSDGDDQIKTKIAEFGEDEFGIGQDVAIWKLARAVDVPGIGGLELRVKAGAPPGPGDIVNIVVARAEHARFSTTRITVVQV